MTSRVHVFEGGLGIKKARAYYSIFEDCQAIALTTRLPCFQLLDKQQNTQKKTGKDRFQDGSKFVIVVMVIIVSVISVVIIKRWVPCGHNYYFGFLWLLRYD